MDDGKATHPERVVVIGASLAGLFAAAAAARAGRSVTILERDELPAGPVPRRGVPQGAQPHVLLFRGLLAAGELLPDLRADLVAAGGIPFDSGDLPWLSEYGWLPLGRKAFEVVSASRPLIEQTVRRLVLGLPGVTLTEGFRARGLDRDGGRWRVQSEDGRAIAAGLVVDASGRSSRLPEWLRGLGVDPGPTTEVDARVGYATRLYEQAPGDRSRTGAVLLSTPQTLTGGMALPAEGGRWMVLAAGFGDHRPPRDVPGFLHFLGGLRDPVLHELATTRRPLGDVVVYRQTGNLRHHYERVRDWPEGLLPVGDALCAFNPLYGQGITVSAIEALLLRDALLAGPLHARALVRRFGRAIALPWSVATSVDLAYPTTSGRPGVPQRAFDLWVRELSLLAVHGNEHAVDALGRLYQLMAGPGVLFHPDLVAAVLRARAFGRAPAAPRPGVLAAFAAG